SERGAFHKIGKVVDPRKGRAKFTRQASPAGDATRVNEVKGANSVVRQAPEQGAKNHFAAPRRDVLKHDERVQEIEVAGYILQTAFRLEQCNVPDAGLFTILFRLVKHRIGHVDRHHLRDATRERDCYTPDSTAEIERPPGGEFRVQALLYGRKNSLDMIGA